MKKSIFPREQKRGSSLVNLNLFLFFVINDNICLGAKTQPSILEKGGGGEIDKDNLFCDIVFYIS